MGGWVIWCLLVAVFIRLYSLAYSETGSNSRFSVLIFQDYFLLFFPFFLIYKKKARETFDVFYIIFLLLLRKKGKKDVEFFWPRLPSP